LTALLVDVTDGTGLRVSAAQSSAPLVATALAACSLTDI
jgi:hypothetical protein